MIYLVKNMDFAMKNHVKQKNLDNHINDKEGSYGY